MTRLNKLDVGRGPYIPLCASCREIRYDPELFEDGNIIDRGNKRADTNANASVSVRMSLRCKPGPCRNPSSLTNLMSSCAFSPDDYEGRRCLPPPRYSGSHVTAVGFGGAGCARVDYLCGGLTSLADSSTSGVRLSHRGSARFVGGWGLCGCRAVVASRAGRSPSSADAHFLLN